MNTRKMWTAGAGAIGLGLLTLVGGAGGQPDSANQMHQRCVEAAHSVTELRHEIQGIEQRLDQSQKTLANAKGNDAKLAAMETVVNEMADQRTQVDQKILAMQSIISGHVLEHLAASGDAGRKSLDNCPVYKYLTGVAGSAETTRETPKKK